MLVPILLAAMIAVLLALGWLLRRRAGADEPARPAASAPLVPLPRTHAVDARHWNSAYWD
ncbi:hypothetical protein [Jiangella alkaliphila]|uniref:Uncharacterized protein n=1 Tax=Jiangella alkaliphila TaxID=419479 RepID=A0A1H2LLL0_9ACTN|nr:hypothetical protein [Jiangella alkaliphila]SDU81635.1 hypothetical protein SAMN04488563_6346 [Jiangella alkaliphila]